MSISKTTAEAIINLNAAMIAVDGEIDDKEIEPEPKRVAGKPLVPVVYIPTNIL